MLLKMRQEGALVIREADWLRFIRSVRNLDGYSSNWLAAGWAMVGVAFTLAGVALTVPGYALAVGAFAALCGVGAGGCFAAHRDVNRKREDAAEELAQEMEEAGDVDSPAAAGGRADTRGDPGGT
jgi:nitrogen fixation protein FixH